MFVLVHDFPLGTPRVSCFLDSDEAFMIYRRFGCLYSRLLLHKQDEMRRLEESLMMIDQNDNYLAGEGKVSKFLYSPTLDEHRDELPPQWSESRPHLLRRLEKTALEYGMSFGSSGMRKCNAKLSRS